MFEFERWHVSLSSRPPPPMTGLSQWHPVKVKCQLCWMRNDRKPGFRQGQRLDHSLMKKGCESEESVVPLTVPISTQIHHRLLSSSCQMYLPPPLDHLRIYNSSWYGLILIPNPPNRTATVPTKGRLDYLFAKINICMESLKYVVFPRVRL